MSWYKKYLSIYGKEISETPPHIIREITEKLKDKKNNLPLVSVVVIAHNEEKNILSCLWSLADNKCDFPVEIIVVNNNSTDHTGKVLEMVGAYSINENKKGPGHARQCGLDNAKGTYYLSMDSDTIYPKYYIQTMTNYLRKDNNMVVTGLWNFIPDKKNGRFILTLYETLRNVGLKLQSIKRPELVVRGAISGFRIKEARKYGYRTDIRRGEDGSLALALKKDGKIKFTMNKKTCVMTDPAVLSLENSLIKSVFIRVIKILKNIPGLFRKKAIYKDEDSNLI